MKSNSWRRPPTEQGARLLTFALLLAATSLGALAAESPSSRPTERRGAILYVSKLGDNSDGSSWQKAFHTLQAALQAVPDDKGGHRVVVRPDTYAEANLHPAQKGALNAYCTLEGDWDGSLGSGATGWVVLDSGAPLAVVRTNPKAPTGNPTYMISDTGDPQQETGLKSVDWWSGFAARPDFSSVGWDRWIVRRVYSTGSDAGLFWDLPPKIEPFTIVVEDSVGIGRAFGGGAAHFSARAEEPIIFRRCTLWCLDWWGDAAGAYVRAENTSLPNFPDVTFEDCTLAGPDNALQAGNPGFSGFTRVKLKGCRLISLNFSQPQGTPSTGIIYSTIDGKLLQADLEDCTLMGYKVFGAGKGEVGFSLKGKVQAYVQYRQPVPAGFERLRFWPVEMFNELVPARGPLSGSTPSGSTTPLRPKLTKIPMALGSAMENTPVIFNSRPLLVLNYRDDTKNKTDAYKKSMYLYIKDLATGNEIARFGEGHSFANAYVRDSELNVFASEGTDRDWFQSLHRFWSTNLTNWQHALAIPQEAGEHLFNASVCRDDKGYLMAYESDKPVAFCFKFARSADLSRWEKFPGLVFTGVNNEYSACPVIRYFAPYYYVIYLHTAIPGHSGYVSFLARSKDLVTWELSPFNPILEASIGEGINNSDVDLFEYEGNTYLFYATGDQQTWGAVRTAQYAGPMNEFFSRHFPEGLPSIKLTTKR